MKDTASLLVTMVVPPNLSWGFVWYEKHVNIMTIFEWKVRSLTASYGFPRILSDRENKEDRIVFFSIFFVLKNWNGSSTWIASKSTILDALRSEKSNSNIYITIRQRNWCKIDVFLKYTVIFPYKWQNYEWKMHEAAEYKKSKNLSTFDPSSIFTFVLSGCSSLFQAIWFHSIVKGLLCFGKQKLFLYVVGGLSQEGD